MSMTIGMSVVVSHRQTLLEKSLVTLAVFPCAGRMQFDDV